MGRRLRRQIRGCYVGQDLTMLIKTDRGRVMRFDLGTMKVSSMQSPSTTAEGFMRCDGLPSRTGVFLYANADGTLRRELRLPEDVFDEKSLKSYEGRPLTNTHPGEPVTKYNAKKFAVGSVLAGASRAEDGNHVFAPLMFTDAQAIRDVRDGRDQLSSGYSVRLEARKGEHPLWGPHDFIQRDITINHLAAVDLGRAGSTAKIKMDHADDCVGGMIFKYDADAGLMVEDAVLNAKALKTLAATSFAVPSSRQLPIHDAPHVRAAMARFGQTRFASASEKRTAFNRIVTRAKELGIDASGFVKTWGNRLDVSEINTNRGNMAEKKTENENPKKPATGVTPERNDSELRDLLGKSKTLLADETRRADTLQLKLEDETKRADTAEARADEHEAEIKSLKENQIDDALVIELREQLKTVTDERDAAIEKLKTALDPKKNADEAAFRAFVISKADPIINADAGKKPSDLYAMPNKDIMVEAIKLRRGEDISGRSDDYIRSRFETVVEAFDSGKDAIAKLRVATSTLDPREKRALAAGHADHKDARADYLERQKNGWQPTGSTVQNKPATKGA